MSQRPEIDYEALVERSIKDFRPVKRLWPVGVRLAVWVMLEAGILALVSGWRGLAVIHSVGSMAGIAAFLLEGVSAGNLALRSAIPGREAGWRYFLLLPPALFALSIAGIDGPATTTLSPQVQVGSILALGALPWVGLFWAVRRGVSTHPGRTGALVGLAAFCLGLANHHSILGTLQYSPRFELISGVIITAVSACAGALWLDRVRRWHKERLLTEVRNNVWGRYGARVAFPLAFGAAIAALLLVVVNVTQPIASIPDFDLAIEKYHQSLAGFKPNVPSGSVQAVLTAYIEHGMPSYMWDFGPEGFRLVGGRVERLPDGVPVTYTWFAGAKGGVMCMFRQTDGFAPPSAVHAEHNHLLFYRYRGFSICLTNVGGYGTFISVIAAPLPMPEFMHLVLTTVR